MIEIPSLRPETRYGTPTCDRFLFNRLYIVGYSYLLRQPRFAMQRINSQSMAAPPEKFKRLDNFREDPRISYEFRSTLEDYEKSGFDRGHLINSADRSGSKIANSETFLMSNMAPQLPDLNRKIWLKLEDAVRVLARKPEYHEVYTICGPLFNSVLNPTAKKKGQKEPTGTKKVDSTLTHIGENKVAVPHAFFKAVLAEKAKAHSKRQLEIWCFEMPNLQAQLNADKQAGKTLKDYLVKTSDTERRAGLQIWDRLRGDTIDALKDKKNRMWSLEEPKSRRDEALEGVAASDGDATI